MPPRTSRRKRYGKKKASYTRYRRRYRRRYPSTNQMVHGFQRSMVDSNYTVVSTVDAPSNNGWWDARGMTFDLTQVTNYNEITNLFDQYAITGVKLTFVPLTNVQGAGTQGSTALPRCIPQLYWYIDLDSAATPNSIDEMMENQRCHSRRFDKPVSIFLRPKPHNNIGGGVAILKGRNWIDCANNPSVDHYGLKWAIQVPDGNSISNTPWFAYKLLVKYYILARHPR